MNDYRIEAATKEEWAERALRAEAKLTWQPIETAPKDGTEILACAAWQMDDGVYRIGWLAEGYLDGNTWSFASFDLDADEYSRPTHWMPLPAPPLKGETDE